MERKQFTFYRSFFEAAMKITDTTERLELLEAVCSYALDEVEPVLSGSADLAFTLIKPTLDAAHAYAEAGARGGRAGKGALQGGLHESGKQLSKVENEKEIEKEIESENYTAPALTEISTYINEKRLSIDPQAFFDYYQMRGWRTKDGRIISDWKAAARNWAKREGTGGSDDLVRKAVRRKQ